MNGWHPIDASYGADVWDLLEAQRRRLEKDFEYRLAATKAELLSELTFRAMLDRMSRRFRWLIALQVAVGVTEIAAVVWALHFQ